MSRTTSTKLTTYGWFSCQGRGALNGGATRPYSYGTGARHASGTPRVRARRAGGRADLSKQADLHPQRVEELVVLELLQLEHLDCDLTPRLLILPLVHRRLGAGAELLLHLITLPDIAHLHIRQRLHPRLDIHLPQRERCGELALTGTGGAGRRTFAKSTSDSIVTFSDAMVLEVKLRATYASPASPPRAKMP